MLPELADQKLQAGLDLLATAVLFISREGRLVWCNSAAEALIGASRRGLRDSPVGALLPQLEGWLSAFAAGDEKCGPFAAIIDLRRPMRDPEPVHATASLCPGDSRFLIVELAAVSQDLELFRQRQQEEQDEATRALLRNLAHEVKNPLGGIRGAAQLLEPELITSDLREYTGVIIGEADRLQALVDHLLAPYRGERLVAEVNIYEVLERVRNLLLAEFPHGLTVVRDYDVSAPPLLGDREQLIQVFLNLTRNAAQALTEAIADRRGEILLRVRVARQVAVQRQMCRLALSAHVIDNGPGIDPAIRDKIFYPLVSGRDEGTGLGLALVKNFVEQNGGSVTVDSVPGRTDFHVLLPLPDAVSVGHRARGAKR